MSRLSKLSKIISHALRHNPQEYGLELDKQGWTSLENLVIGLRNNAAGYADTTAEEIKSAVSSGDKVRHEIKDGKIRAIYGHSIKEKIEKTATISNLPNQLYHGTTSEAWEAIKVQGLSPRGRQYVHLSETPELAKIVGKRRTQKPVILVVDTEKAKTNKVNFYAEQNGVWLSDEIPRICLDVFKRH